MSTSEVVTRFRVSKAIVAQALGETDVIEWRSDNDNLILIHKEVETPDTPSPNADRLQQQIEYYPWADVFAVVFPGVPVVPVTMVQEGNFLYFVQS